MRSPVTGQLVPAPIRSWMTKEHMHMYHTLNKSQIRSSPTFPLPCSCFFLNLFSVFLLGFLVYHSLGNTCLHAYQNHFQLIQPQRDSQNIRGQLTGTPGLWARTWDVKAATIQPAGKPSRNQPVLLRVRLFMLGKDWEALQQLSRRTGDFCHLTRWSGNYFSWLTPASYCWLSHTDHVKTIPHMELYPRRTPGNCLVGFWSTLKETNM